VVSSAATTTPECTRKTNEQVIEQRQPRPTRRHHIFEAEGPPVAYAYITKTKGQRGLARGRRIALGLLVLAEMFAALAELRIQELPGRG